MTSLDVQLKSDPCHSNGEVHYIHTEAVCIVAEDRRNRWLLLLVQSMIICLTSVMVHICNNNNILGSSDTG